MEVQSYRRFQRILMRPPPPHPPNLFVQFWYIFLWERCRAPSLSTPAQSQLVKSAGSCHPTECSPTFVACVSDDLINKPLLAVCAFDLTDDRIAQTCSAWQDTGSRTRDHGNNRPWHSYFCTTSSLQANCTQFNYTQKKKKMMMIKLYASIILDVFKTIRDGGGGREKESCQPEMVISGWGRGRMEWWVGGGGGERDGEQQHVYYLPGAVSSLRR